MKLLAPLAVLLLPLVLSGCKVRDPFGHSAPSCVADTDCEDDLVCEDGECVDDWRGSGATSGSTVSSATSGTGGSGSSSTTSTGAGGVESNCCIEHDEPGCNQASVQVCTCTVSSACCSGPWDNQCIAIAEANCGVCGEGPTSSSNSSSSSGGGNDCCTAHASPGCNDDAQEVCICALFPSCCTTTWTDDCALGCAFCMP